MRGLTLTQPWATLVAIGAKALETRGWTTGYRGPVAIHAAKGYPPEARALRARPPFAGELVRAGYPLVRELPLGAIVAVAQLVGVERTEAVEPVIRLRDVARRVGQATCSFDGVTPAEHELAFGDYSPGRFAWLLADVRPLREPIPCRGALGLWQLPADVHAAIDLHLGGVAA